MPVTVNKNARIDRYHLERFGYFLEKMISQMITPVLRPRYVASVEERVMIDIPKMQRIPDL